MTGTTVDIELVKSCKEMKVNRVLAELYYDAMTRIPVPEYTDEELKFAATSVKKPVSRTTAYTLPDWNR